MRTLVSVVALVAGLAPSAAGAFEKTLAIQGVLRTAGGEPATDGSYGATLAVYDGPGTGAAKLYTEAHPAIVVVDGVFSAVVGSVDPLVNPLPTAIFFAHEALWIGARVGDEPELPRVPLRPVPWAIRAARADDLACSGCVTSAHLASSVLAPFATLADVAATYVEKDGDTVTGALVLSGVDGVAPLVLGTAPPLGRLLRRSDGAVALSRGGGWDGAWKPDVAGKPVTALVLGADGRARLEVDAASRPLGAVQVVEATLAPGEAIDLPHGRDTLDLVATGWVLEEGDWTAVGGSVGGGLAADPEHLVHWSLNGCDGEDGSGSGYDGTVVGPLGCVTGKVGKALSWDGAAFRHVKLPLDAKLAGLSKAHTFSMWLLREQHNKTMHFLSYDDGNNNHLFTVDGGGGIGISWNGAGVAVSGAVPVQQWTHVATTYDGTTWRVYVNGVQTHQSAQSSLTIGIGNCILLGEDADANCAGGADADVWKGAIDEFHVFGRALTPAEVVRVMNDDLAGGGSDADVRLIDANTVRLTSRRVETATFRLVIVAP